MRIRTALFGSLATTLLCGAALPGCGQEKSTPGLMLSFSSDMSVPKDITAVGLYIRTKTGTVIYSNVVDAMTDGAGNRSVRLPATFAILSNGSAATVKVQLIAYGTTRKPFVIRQSTAGVPTNRLSILRMPLLWLNQGSASTGSVIPTSTESGLRAQSSALAPLAAEGDLTIPGDGFPTPCKGENQSYIGGKCRDVDPEASLPDYVAADDPTSPEATCFSVEKCFAKPTSLKDRIRDDGSVDLGGTQATIVNLALVTKDNVGIKLPDGRFAITLDADSALEGYSIKNNTIVLSDVVREALKAGRATDLIATTDCAEKTAESNVCGPWNPSKNEMGPGAHGNTPPPVIGGDAGPIASDAGDGGPIVMDAGDASDGAIVMPKVEEVGPPEPGLSGLAFSPTKVFTMRNGANVPLDGGMFDNTVRATDKLNPQSGQPLSNDLFNPGAGYRLFYGEYGAGATAPWISTTNLFVTNASLSYISRIDFATNKNTQLTYPAGFQPLGLHLGTDSPLAVGTDQGGTFGAYRLLGTFITAAVTGVPNGHLPTAMTSLSPTTFLLATDLRDLRICTRNANSLDCGNLLANGSDVAPDGRIVEVASDGVDYYALVVHPTAIETVYEGVYKVVGGNFKAVATNLQYPELHFEMAGAAHNWMTIAPTGKIGFMSTAAGGGHRSRLYSFDPSDTTGKNAPKVIADNFEKLRDVALDPPYVYAVDYGSGQKADGRIFRVVVP